MALSGNTVLEVRLTGSDTNGGGFVTGSSGTDWSQQNTAQYAVVDGVTAGTTTITSATANFGTDVVGNLIYVQGGTGSVSANWYQITSRTNNTTIVVDRSTGLTAGTGVTLNIGGALASPGMASFIMNNQNVQGITTYIKYNASPYVITTATASVSGGCLSTPSNPISYIGYDTTRSRYTPFQNRPTLQLQAGVSSAVMVPISNNASSIQSIIFDANSQTTSSIYQGSGECFYVKGMNATNNGFKANTVSSSSLVLCELTGMSGSATLMNAEAILWCVSHDNTATGNAISGAKLVYGCISYGNSGNGFGPITGGSDSIWFVNCTSYNNTGKGFYFGNTSALYTAINCIAEANQSYGYYVNTAGPVALINCADYNNTSGRKNSGTGFWSIDSNPITGTSSFFNSAGTDFGPNNTANAGALLRAAGFPSFPGSNGFVNLSSTEHYLDVGAIQHQDTGGTSGPVGQQIGM